MKIWIFTLWSLILVSKLDAYKVKAKFDRDKVRFGEHFRATCEKTGFGTDYDLVWYYDGWRACHMSTPREIRSCSDRKDSFPDMSIMRRSGDLDVKYDCRLKRTATFRCDVTPVLPGFSRGSKTSSSVSLQHGFFDDTNIVTLRYSNGTMVVNAGEKKELFCGGVVGRREDVKIAWLARYPNGTEAYFDTVQQTPKPASNDLESKCLLRLNSSLMFNPTQSDNGVSLRCIIKGLSSKETSKDTLTLNVQYKVSKMNIHLSGGGSNTSVLCAANGNPTPKLTLLQNNILVKEMTANQLLYKLEDTSLSEALTFTCHAQNLLNPEPLEQIVTIPVWNRHNGATPTISHHTTTTAPGATRPDEQDDRDPSSWFVSSVVVPAIVIVCLALLITLIVVLCFVSRRRRRRKEDMMTISRKSIPIRSRQGSFIDPGELSILYYTPDGKSHCAPLIRGGRIDELEEEEEQQLERCHSLSLKKGRPGPYSDVRKSGSCIIVKRPSNLPRDISFQKGPSMQNTVPIAIENRSVKGTASLCSSPLSNPRIIRQPRRFKIRKKGSPVSLDEEVEHLDVPLKGQLEEVYWEVDDSGRGTVYGGSSLARSSPDVSRKSSKEGSFYRETRIN